MAPIYHTLDDQFQAQQLAAFSVNGAPDGRAASPLNGERLQSHDQLEAMNSQLKTRVSELEVIQELYRGRLQQLEEEEKLRQSQEAGKIEAQLRAEINMLRFVLRLVLGLVMGLPGIPHLDLELIEPSFQHILPAMALLQLVSQLRLRLTQHIDLGT